MQRFEYADAAAFRPTPRKNEKRRTKNKKRPAKFRPLRRQKQICSYNL